MHPSDEAQTNNNDAVSAIAGIDRTGAGRTSWNFIWMSVSFSANHGCVVACLSLATARLGSVGAWQSGVLYISYTASAVFGATTVVKQLGPKNALMGGMALYCVYVGCFLIATLSPSIETPAALLGAAIGGAGAGSLWTAQGSYFGRASEDHAAQLQQPVQLSNQRLASIFASIYFAAEVALRSLSTLLLELGWSWSAVFGSYTAVTLFSAFMMLFAYDYPTQAGSSLEDSTNQSANTNSFHSARYKESAAWQILSGDPKMKYMIGLNAVFGLTSAFLNSYINGEVVQVVTKDNNSKSVGLFNAWVSCVAAFMSLLFGQISSRIGNGPILIFGAICFLGVVFPFVVVPDTKKWSMTLLTCIYTFHGCGRATFEGTLKATFADYFAYEKEGAFANIILQSGLSGAIGFILTFSLLCSQESHHCVRYHDGTLHDVFSFELIVIISSAAAILGYLRASRLRLAELRAMEEWAAGEDSAMIAMPRNQNE